MVQCVEVEALLAEALDGTLHGSQLAAFEAHQQSCAACRTMVEEASAGMHWLKGLDEAEPPRNLVHNILAQTIGALPSEHIVRSPRGEGWLEKLKGRLAPLFAPVATPRFAMSFGMAFFSITMLLGIAGFHLSDLRNWTSVPRASPRPTTRPRRGWCVTTRTCAWCTRLSRACAICAGLRLPRTRTTTSHRRLPRPIRRIRRRATTGNRKIEVTRTIAATMARHAGHLSGRLALAAKQVTPRPG